MNDKTSISPTNPIDGFTRVRPRRAFEAVTQRLREMISEGDLKSGDKLPPERELCDRLGVGRASLREALRSLESAGVLELRTGRTGGAFVTSGDTGAIASGMRDLLYLQNMSFADLTEARLRITRIVVELAITRLTAEDIAALNANIAEAQRLFAAGRLMDKTQKNIEFHIVLARAAKNPIFVLLVQTLTDLFVQFVRRLGSETTRDTFESRRRFMAALERGDLPAAIDEMDSNLHKVHALYSRLAERAGTGPEEKSNA